MKLFLLTNLSDNEPKCTFIKKLDTKQIPNVICLISTPEIKILCSNYSSIDLLDNGKISELVI